MLTFPPDFSFLVQIGSFLLLWFGLKRLLFDPVLQVLQDREDRTSGLEHEASQIRTNTDAVAAEYEHRMHEVRLTLTTEAEGERAATQAEERRVLTEARNRAATQLNQLRENLRHQAAAARPALADEASDLSVRIIERVVGRTPA